jgi:hypothetical protein
MLTGPVVGIADGEVVEDESVTGRVFGSIFEETRLPSGGTGPVDFAALARFARILISVTILAQDTRGDGGQGAGGNGKGFTGKGMLLGRGGERQVTAL